ncbi:hypothetical protein NDU88_005392 [Pleurodeles waltl]|uniref:Uncharacterized protein n=1 Tax=Pleurodeles waltl TaxID=8319 RepID=A0AAV7WUN0_PLEWA|nr:hypothetical protein NDU88_005392 [Pleurodeles waltl]
MMALRNQTAHFRSLAQENLEANQEDMKQWYDRNATLVEFQPGQKVWVMAPVEPRALQDKWTGPSEVVERKSEITYLVDLQSPMNPLRFLHFNRLKPHFERTELSMLLATNDGLEENEPLPDLLSPWASPVVLVPKAAAPGATPELRFCVDYRGLNADSKTDAHPNPRADELIDRLGAAKYLIGFTAETQCLPAMRPEDRRTELEKQHATSLREAGEITTPATWFQIIVRLDFRCKHCSACKNNARPARIREC